MQPSSHLCCLLGSLLLAAPATATEPQSAMEILQRVQDIRSRIQLLRLRLVMRTENRRTKVEDDIRAELLGDKVRFDILPRIGNDLVHQNVVLDGDEVRRYRRSENSDVCLMSRDYVVNHTGQIIFDPRLLGLDEIRTCDSNIRDSFTLDVAKSAEIETKEIIAERVAWRIKSTLPTGAVTFWIDALNDRVHRVCRESPALTLDIHSEFNAEISDSPIPVHVRVRRSDESWQTTYEVFGLDTRAPISPSTLR